MEDPVKSDARLEVSVSFGRFENDALSWEKFSAFSPNKYLEEVGTLSTPGSVAQKKAYFEAHYKKIAAKKAEELEQENSADSVITSQDVSNEEDHVENSSEIDIEVCPSNGERLVEEVEQEAHVLTVEQEASVVTVLENETIADETKDDGARLSEGLEQGACENGSIDVISSEEEKEEVKVELNANLVYHEINVKDEPVSIGVEIPNMDSQKILEKPRQRKIGVEQLKKGNSKPNARIIAQKVTPTKKERNLVGAKKKIVSPAAKPLQASTPRYSKPATMSSPISASQSLKKKVNGSPLPKSKNLAVGESKKAAPTSLHMSLSLGPKNSMSNLPVMRKSLIMEQMGDKDIVKRAFKSFQNRSIGSYSDEKASTVKNVSSTAFEPKVSTFRTPTKGSEGPRKDAQKTATPRSHSGTRSNPLPSRSHKSSIPDRKITTAFSPAIALRSDEKAEKRKDFLKKLEARSIARVAENAQLSAKAKEEKDSEIKKVRQSHNLKAKSKSSSNQGQGKGHLEKGGS